MDRLTVWDGFKWRTHDPIDTVEDYSAINLQKLIDKLAHYEDLQEAGRLVVLPEGDGRTIFLNVLAVSDEICPSNLGLKNIHCTLETDCVECWEAALKGR